MAVSDVEAVLEYLRRNGLSDAESALVEDLMERPEFCSSDFQKFLFPMAPPPPQLRIPATRLPPPRDSEEARGSESSDEFVSLGSSTTNLCSSDFTNPYGIKNATRASSQTSSDRLSQFGTARDYHEFDMQNDLNWYKEKDEDYAISPSFGSLDPFGGPTEDKFVMTMNVFPYTATENELAECGMKASPTYDLVGESASTYYLDGSVAEKDFYPYDNCNCEGAKHFEDDKEVPDHASSQEEDDTAINDFFVHSSNEDEYEEFDLKIIHRKNRTGFEENKDLPIVLNGMIASRYLVTEYLGSAAFSKVVQAQDLQTGVDVCLKIIKNDKDFFDQSLDEIKLLKFANKYDPGDARHILRLFDYYYFQEHLIIVCELLKANLYEFQKYNRESEGEPYFTMYRLQTIARQCLEALEYLHELGIIHCDLKPENILIKSYSRCEIKVIDLGSSCFQNDNLSLYVQSRSYRAPEVILGLPYNHKIDLWSLGCILSELCSGEVLFPNEAIVFILARIIGMLGPLDPEMLVRGQETEKYFTEDYDLYHINEETNQMEYVAVEETFLEHRLQVSDTAFTDFVRHLLELNPQKRPTAREALQHPWLSSSYEFNS